MGKPLQVCPEAVDATGEARRSAVAVRACGGRSELWQAQMVWVALEKDRAMVPFGSEARTVRAATAAMLAKATPWQVVA